jgi:transcriptional regulator with XRE-family HTH domain
VSATFSEALRAAMVARNLDGQALAQAAEVSAATVSGALRGRPLTLRSATLEDFGWAEPAEFMAVVTRRWA